MRDNQGVVHKRFVDHAAWVTWRARRQRRIVNLTLFANVVATQIVLLSLGVQFERGLLSRYAWSQIGVYVTVGALAASAVLLVVTPTATAHIMGRALRVFGAPLVGMLTAVALSVVFIVAWPFARFIGRRAYRKHHTQSAHWVTGAGPTWRDGHFVTKQSEADHSNGSRSVLLGLLAYFAAQRNLLVLVVLIATLVAVSLSAFTHTSYLAPFVYTLF